MKKDASPEIDSNLAVDSVVIPVKLCNLPPLNAIASQILALSSDPEVELKHLSVVMARDPAFAADVLFLANSSLFGFPSRMHVLSHAVAILGLDRIKALAVTVAMRGFLGKGTPLVRQCWQHSAASAIIAEEIAPLFGITSEVAYTVALMHDVGRLGLLKSYPKESSAVLNNPFDSVSQVLDAERLLLNVHHGHAGAWMASNWGFPRSFRDVCEHHHDPGSAQDSELLLLVKAACKIADSLGYSAVQYTRPVRYTELELAVPTSLRRDGFPSESALRTSLEAKLKAFV